MLSLVYALSNLKTNVKHPQIMINGRFLPDVWHWLRPFHPWHNAADSKREREQEGEGEREEARKTLALALALQG